MKIEMTVNGELCHFDVPPLTPLLTVLRKTPGLKGAKWGCGEGECGACSMIVDGRLMNSCLIPAVQVSGSEILTVEGLGGPDEMDMLQKAFVTEGAVQCGLCTPGMVMAARALLEENPSPTREEIKIALSGNICRCTGYEKIFDAVERAVREGYCKTFKPRPNLCGSVLPAAVTENDKNCLTPRDLQEALEVLAENENVTVMAGCTELILDIKNGKLLPQKLADLSRIKELRETGISGGSVRIGSSVTNGDLIRSGTIKKYLPALWEAAFRSGAPAVQNRATVGGNLATASGAADLPSILLPLNACIVVESVRGSREMNLEDFIIGYRKTDLRKGEIIREIVVPLPKENSVQRFYKRGSRKSLTLSRISLGFYAEVENGVAVEFRAAAGSMSPTPIRLKKLESSLKGRRLTAKVADEAAVTAYEEVEPRKSSQWRKTVTSNLVRKFLKEITP